VSDQEIGFPFDELLNSLAATTGRSAIIGIESCRPADRKC